MVEIKEYLVKKLGMSPVVADMTIKKLSKHEEIYAEFVMAVDTEKIPDDGVVINGYSATDIHNLAGFMNVAGVYNFLLTLKENPKMAQKMIDDSFPRK